LLVALLAFAVPISVPPAKSGQCGWVHGRYAVYNGSGVRRIWVIGTHRIIALADSDEDVPSAIVLYQQAGTTDPLFGDFYVCAREPSRAGHMQHVRLERTRHLSFQGRPFPAK
jgi:hypothetical protein